MKPSKCFVAVALSHCSGANDIFRDSGMQIVTSHKFLEVFIGHSLHDDQKKLIMQKVLQWSTHVRTFASIASMRP